MRFLSREQYPSCVWLFFILLECVRQLTVKSRFIEVVVDRATNSGQAKL